MSITIDPHAFDGDQSSVWIHGYQVTLLHDAAPANPRDMGDCGVPMARAMPGRHRTPVSADDYDVTDFFDRVSPRWVSRNWRAIAAILDLNQHEFDAECRAEQSDANACGWDRVSLSTIRLEYFRERLSDILDRGWGGICDGFECLVSLYALLDIPAVHEHRHGYSQGDSIAFLAVNLPEWRAVTGAPKTAETMIGEIDELAAYIFGDVWGFCITDPDGEEDYCFGFYGRYWDSDFYMWEVIADQIQAELDRRHMERQSRLKSLIRNNVPLPLRPSLLGAPA